MARKLAMTAALAALAMPGAAYAAGPGDVLLTGGLPLPPGAIAGGNGGVADDEHDLDRCERGRPLRRVRLRRRGALAGRAPGHHERLPQGPRDRRRGAGEPRDRRERAAQDRCGAPSRRSPTTASASRGSRAPRSTRPTPTRTWTSTCATSRARRRCSPVRARRRPDLPLRPLGRRRVRRVRDDVGARGRRRRQRRLRTSTAAPSAAARPCSSRARPGRAGRRRRLIGPVDQRRRPLGRVQLGRERPHRRFRRRRRRDRRVRPRHHRRHGVPGQQPGRGAAHRRQRESSDPQIAGTPGAAPGTAYIAYNSDATDVAGGGVDARAPRACTGAGSRWSRRCWSAARTASPAPTPTAARTSAASATRARASRSPRTPPTSARATTTTAPTCATPARARPRSPRPTTSTRSIRRSPTTAG